MRLLAVDGSPQGGGRTSLVLAAVLAGGAESGADTAMVSLAGGEPAIAAAVAQLTGYDAFVLGAPAYRAAAAAPMKAFLDVAPRGFWGEKEQPMTGRAVGLVMTGASLHHYLAMDGLRSVLAGFFAAHVLSPGLYLTGDAFTTGGEGTKVLTPEAAESAIQLGRTIVALARAIEVSPQLQAVRPQA